MAYFPFMVDITGWSCLVAGGGRIAFRKVQQLLEFGVNIKVVAEIVCDELKRQKDDRLVIEERVFQDTDVEVAQLVVAATDDELLNCYISELCREKRIPVNVVDMQEACSFIFPAMLRRQDLLVAISTGGNSPAAAAYIKNRLDARIPEYYGEMIETLGAYREYIMQNVDSARERKEIFYKLLEYGDAHGGEIPPQVVKRVIEEQSKNGKKESD